MELPVTATAPADDRRASYRLEIKNLSYKLSREFGVFNWVDSFGWFKGRDEKFILKCVSCKANPGEITAIAGPSGAGKTTLLEILAGKISPSDVTSGQILVNNRPIDPVSFRRISGFVTQEDALFPLLTVQETLIFSALLRLKRPKKDALRRVEILIQELGLGDVAGSRIGEGSNFGISGGERRRVSIAVDLVHDPDVLLIDEPTSGLDSASALQIVTLLKEMAVKQGKTVVMTIHQPGFRILEQINRVILLSNGLVVHDGSLNLLNQKLKFVVRQIPRRVNVLEYAIDIAERLESFETKNFLEISKFDHTNVLNQTNFCNESEKARFVDHNNSVFEEILILAQRSCKNIFRTKQLFATRAIQASVAGLILGSIYSNVGNHTGKLALQTRIGFFAFSLTFLLSSTTEGLPIFLKDKRILMRETSRRAYKVLSYVLADTLIFIPFLLIISLLFATPVYWIIGLRNQLDGFLYFSMVVWMVLLMSNSFVACFSALVPNFIMGSSVIAGLMGSFFLFSGYFISKEKIPNYWIFMHYLSLFKYPFECLMINEYGGEEGGKKCLNLENGECDLNGNGFLRQQNVSESLKWSNLGVMACFIVGYRVLSFVILWYKCYRTRN